MMRHELAKNQRVNQLLQEAGRGEDVGKVRGATMLRLVRKRMSDDPAYNTQAQEIFESHQSALGHGDD
jgi:hypothetical protein